jgi:hypothetical protein
VSRCHNWRIGSAWHDVRVLPIPLSLDGERPEQRNQVLAMAADKARGQAGEGPVVDIGAGTGLGLPVIASIPERPR